MALLALMSLLQLQAAVTEHAGELLRREAREPGRERLSAARVHAHVQGPVESKRKPARARVELMRGDAEIGEDRVHVLNPDGVDAGNSRCTVSVPGLGVGGNASDMNRQWSDPTPDPCRHRPRGTRPSAALSGVQWPGQALWGL